jgi:hypothetical protein
MLWTRGAVELTPPIREHYCPACQGTSTTRETLPHTRMHSCPKVGGMTVPMVPVGTRAKLVVHLRDDYVADEDVQYDENGRPVMAVETVRDEGTDLTVYAPCARAELR